MPFINLILIDYFSKDIPQFTSIQILILHELFIFSPLILRSLYGAPVTSETV